MLGLRRSAGPISSLTPDCRTKEKVHYHGEGGREVADDRNLGERYACVPADPIADRLYIESHALWNSLSFSGAWPTARP
jgi:hypothetical protein